MKFALVALLGATSAVRINQPTAATCSPVNNPKPAAASCPSGWVFNVYGSCAWSCSADNAEAAGNNTAPAANYTVPAGAYPAYTPPTRE